MSGEDAAAAAVLGDSIDMLGTSFSGLVNTIGATVAPMFTAVLGLMTAGVVQVRNFIAANKGLVTAVVIGAVALGVLGAALLLLPHWLMVCRSRSEWSRVYLLQPVP